ncbi:MAG: hypothetical protein U9O94_02730 [Nanoarchaeota archaeon]|nr:hypothetical protein [Nanoarchaeota archaeon]
MEIGDIIGWANRSDNSLRNRNLQSPGLQLKHIPKLFKYLWRRSEYNLFYEERTLIKIKREERDIYLILEKYSKIGKMMFKKDYEKAIRKREHRKTIRIRLLQESIELIRENLNIDKEMIIDAKTLREYFEGESRFEHKLSELERCKFLFGGSSKLEEDINKKYELEMDELKILESLVIALRRLLLTSIELLKSVKNNTTIEEDPTIKIDIDDIKKGLIQLKINEKKIMGKEKKAQRTLKKAAQELVPV